MERDFVGNNRKENKWTRKDTEVTDMIWRIRMQKNVGWQVTWPDEHTKMNKTVCRTELKNCSEITRKA